MSGDLTDTRAALEAARARCDQLQRRVADARRLVDYLEQRDGAAPTSRCWARSRSWHIFLACTATVIAVAVQVVVFRDQIQEARLGLTLVKEGRGDLDKKLSQLSGQARRVQPELPGLRRRVARIHKVEPDFALPSEGYDPTHKRTRLSYEQQRWHRVGLAACKVKQRALAREAHRELSRLVKALEQDAKNNLDTLLIVAGQGSLRALVGACGDQLHEGANAP
jgi:hypothetical protein